MARTREPAAIAVGNRGRVGRGEPMSRRPVRTVTGLRTDLCYGSDESTLQANSGKIVRGIVSPKGNLILGPWQNTEYYLSIGRGLHSTDLRGTLTNVDALASEINFQQGNPTVVTQGKTPLLTKATGYEAVTAPGRPSQRKGIELTASYKPLSWLRLDGDFAATHARFANGDDGSAVTEPGYHGNYRRPPTTSILGRSNRCRCGSLSA